jgi:hypothetical protein
VGVPVVQVVRQGRLEPTVFLALYLLQVVVEAVLTVVQVRGYQAVPVAVHMLLAVILLVAFLVKVLLAKAMQVGYLMEVQTTPAEEEVVQEQLV